MSEMNIGDYLLAFMGLLIIIIMLGGLFYLAIYEIQDWKDTKKLIRDHNGTCIDKGYSVECAYSESSQIINSNSKCYKNDIEINCSEI